MRLAIGGLLVAGKLVAGCGPSAGTDPGVDAGTRTSPSASGAAGTDARPAFRGREAAERLRQRVVGWVMAAPTNQERVSRFAPVLDALPDGHFEQARLLEALDAAMAAERASRAPPHDIDAMAPRVALAWLARDRPERARATISLVLENPHAIPTSDLEGLVEVVDRLDGRSAALALAEEPAFGEREDVVVATARIEARRGDFAQAAEVARSVAWHDGCAIWAGLIVRHTRDGRDALAGEAWERARAAADLRGIIDGSRVGCLIDLARAATEVGRHDEVARLFATLPTAHSWLACRVLEELGTELDPLRLDVPVAIVAIRREEPGPPRPSCPRTAAWIAARAGQLDLARSLRARAVATGGGSLGGLATDWRHGWLSAIATGEVEPFAEEIDGRSFDVGMIPGLVLHFDERGDQPVDEARFDARFPTDRPPWQR